MQCLRATQSPARLSDLPRSRPWVCGGHRHCVAASAQQPQSELAALVRAAGLPRDGGLEELRRLLRIEGEVDCTQAVTEHSPEGRSERWTALSRAASGNSPAALTLLCSRGGDPNKRLPEGCCLWEGDAAASHGYSLLTLPLSTPLLCAVLNGHEAAVAALLASGADARELHLDEYWPPFQRCWTLLELACRTAATPEEAAQLPLVRMLAAAVEGEQGKPLRCTQPLDPLQGQQLDWAAAFPGVVQKAPSRPPGNGGFGAPWDDGRGRSAAEVLAAHKTV